MPATALRIEEPAAREGIVNYITALCRRCRIRPADVDDVVQEVLTAIHAASFHSDKGDFDTWTRAIAWKVVRKHVQAAQRYDQRFSDYHPNIDEYPSPSPSPERCARRKQAEDCISNALASLSAQYFDVFMLHDFEGFTHEEISEKLDISPANSQKCVQRARLHLAECLKDKVFSAMPLEVVACNDLTTTQVGDSRWNERAHYAGQIAVLILALLLFTPSDEASISHASVTGEISMPGPTNNVAMYRQDQPVDVHDEPVVLHDAPRVKPEPAPLPSVRDVSAPTKVEDKPTYVEPYAPLPPYKHKPHSLDHRLRGR